jgi:anionic cell wall polymer biosynthesis LytR-Cps2A-Psr (LCP) family protein
LKYVRSRHSTSDFDRSLRQQLVIKAVKDKLLQLNYITNPSKLSSLMSTLSEHIKTDLNLKDMLSLALVVKELPNNHILSFNLNDSCFQSVSLCERGGFLYTPQRALFG